MSFNIGKQKANRIINISDNINIGSETQEQREARCHKECEDYFSLTMMSKSELFWFHRGVETGAKMG